MSLIFPAILRTLRSHALFLSLIFSYTVAGLITTHLLDVPGAPALSLYTNIVARYTALFLAVFLLAVHPLYVMVFVRPARLTRYILTDWKDKYLKIDRVIVALPILLFLPIFVSVFTWFKYMIPAINPYGWDVTFAEWDRVLHGGYYPWELLQPVLGYPLVTSVVNFFYQLWFFVLYAVLVWQAFSLRNPRLRMQFFLTFSLSFILLGTLAATLLSSAGPCYFGLVSDMTDPFQPLMGYLRSADAAFPVWSLNVQDMLWERYEMGGLDVGNGISAMPSMHVSSAYLFALVGWRTNRAAGIALTIFLFLIIVGSVHLAWHYAVDDYVAIVGTWFIWRGVNFLLGRDSVFREA
ncbi:MAG: phosphatase PAP2 family protein [Deltaproteobacteria bacterium]|nr:phosphatase PAP2 family protein [Deltaproteobacteria bacterium]